jgi:hypothetical protein
LHRYTVEAEIKSLRPAYFREHGDRMSDEVAAARREAGSAHVDSP